MPKNNDKLDAERNAAKLPDSKFDAKELKKGTDREMEHTKSREEAEKIAKQHLFDNPRYYSELDKAGFEELELEEKWSAKYKKSINCNNPKGFSQRAHCQGRKKKMSETIDEGKNKPTNPGLWSRAKSAARSKFKVYPSAYANAWASKWYKKHGGGWRKAGKKSVKEQQISRAVTPVDDKIYNISRNTILKDKAKNFSAASNPSQFDGLVTKFINTVDTFLKDPKGNSNLTDQAENLASLLLVNADQTLEQDLENFLVQAQSGEQSSLSEAVLSNKNMRNKLVAYMAMTLFGTGLEQAQKMNLIPQSISFEDDGKKDEVGATMKVKRKTNQLAESKLLCECSCGCDECGMTADDYLGLDFGMMDSEPYAFDEEFEEYEGSTEDFMNQSKGNPDLNSDGIFDEDELYYHFDLDSDGQVTPDEYESHVEYHAEHPEILNMKKKQIKPVVMRMMESKWR